MTADKKYIQEMRQLPMDDAQINHENDERT